MFKNLSPIGKLSLSLVIILASALLTFLLSAILAIPIFGVNYFLDPASAASMDNISLVKFFQITQSIGLFIIPSILIAFLMEKSAFTFLQLNRKVDIGSALLVILSIYFLLPVIENLALWNSELQLPESLRSLEEWMRSAEEAAAALTSDFLRMDNASDLWVNLFMIAIIPALGEELLFRGVIQSYLFKWLKNNHAAIWITAFFFSALHFQFYGFIPRLLLGVFFGYVLIWSKNLWYPIIAHLLNNGTAVVYYYFYPEEVTEAMSEAEILPQSIWLTVSSLLIFTGLVLIFIKKQKRLIESVD